LIETPRAVFLIDPCWLPSEVLRIRAFLTERIKDRKLYLIFTHSDYDHILGYGAFPEAKVIASARFAAKDGLRDLEDIRRFDQMHYIERPYPVTWPGVDIVIATDGKAMHFSGTVLTFYLAPGHTPEGLYILVDPPGVWVAGDYLSDVEFPFVEESIAAFRRTMAKTDRILRLHAVEWLIPGHGSVATSRDEILRRRDEAVGYLDDLESVREGRSDFPVHKYRDRYPFWEALQRAHDENLARLKAQAI
ncbi:MAG: MBL fold metallo-hydrolase, partial [Saprospiraceae bacterium]|nr:MBL fold metallo-hydrolase [Saprospiraceae bacterium]